MNYSFFNIPLHNINDILSRHNEHIVVYNYGMFCFVDKDHYNYTLSLIGNSGVKSQNIFSGINESLLRFSLEPYEIIKQYDKWCDNKWEEDSTTFSNITIKNINTWEFIYYRLTCDSDVEESIKSIKLFFNTALNIDFTFNNLCFYLDNNNIVYNRELLKNIINNETFEMQKYNIFYDETDNIELWVNNSKCEFSFCCGRFHTFISYMNKLKKLPMTEDDVAVYNELIKKMQRCVETIVDISYCI